MSRIVWIFVAALFLITGLANYLLRTFPQEPWICGPAPNGPDTVAAIRARAEAGAPLAEVLDDLDRLHAEDLGPGTRGKIEYLKDDALEFAVRTPADYDPGDRWPLVIVLHGAGENPRELIARDWRDSEAIVLAPRGNPRGFYARPKDRYPGLQLMYRTLTEAMKRYRVDWERVFLDLHGPAFQLAFEQTFVFAGFIARDPVEPPEAVRGNLNDVPVCRDDDAEAFVHRHRHRLPRSFTWRFPDDMFASPVPVNIGPANFEGEPGRLRFEVDDNRISIEITKAEGLRIHLTETIVDFDRPVTVVVNGKVVHDGVRVEPDWNIFFDLVLPGRLLMIPFQAQLDCTFPYD